MPDTMQITVPTPEELRDEAYSILDTTLRTIDEVGLNHSSAFDEVEYLLLDYISIVWNEAWGYGDQPATPQQHIEYLAYITLLEQTIAMVLEEIAAGLEEAYASPARSI